MEHLTFKETIIPLREKLIAYSSRIADNQVEAEDVVQDVFLKLWSMRDSLDGYDSVEALAFRMTKNKTLDELRRCRSESIETVENKEYSLSFGADDVEMVVEQKDMVNYVKRLIEMLPSLQQTIIRMKDVEGYELSEIAEITGAQVEAVRTNLSRARKRIREQITGGSKFKV